MPDIHWGRTITYSLFISPIPKSYLPRSHTNTTGHSNKVANRPRGNVYYMSLQNSYLDVRKKLPLGVRWLLQLAEVARCLLRMGEITHAYPKKYPTLPFALIPDLAQSMIRIRKTHAEHFDMDKVGDEFSDFSGRSIMKLGRNTPDWLAALCTDCYHFLAVVGCFIF